MIISCSSHTNASDETNLNTFYNVLSSLVCSILKHYILIIRVNINAQIGKNVNNKFSFHNSSNRNEEYLMDFMLENGLTCFNTKFQERKGKLKTYTYPNKAKSQILLQYCHAIYNQNTIDRWKKGCILPFTKKSDLEIAKNNSYFHSGHDLRCSTTQLHWTQNWENGFWRNWSMTPQILTIHWILEGVCAKSLEATILFVDFSKEFDSIHRGKMEQILLAYGLFKETIAALMMLYKNTKVKTHSLNGDIDFFDIVAGVQQRGTLAPYLFIICLDYVLQMSIDLMKENDFTLAKTRSRGTPLEWLWTWTTLLTLYFWQIHSHRLNPCCIVWNR